jgi:hypothetical protein
MHVLSGLKYLFSVVTIRFAISTYYAMHPRWHPWEKGTLVVLVFGLCLVIVDLLERSRLSISAIACVTTLAQMLRWLLCYVIAQYLVTGVEVVAARWSLSILDSVLLCGSLFLIMCALCMPIALAFGVMWCDCQQPNCLICGLCRDRLKKARVSHPLSVVGRLIPV